ncbi:Ig domain-containing protein [Clostridium botulinum]|uniref:Ig-like domain-containing protein n=1 Tax=Clostridium botulinum TaxID=1491 RepID=UPI00224650AB|nr:Ig-like domain-containing protein [Clostridium botulinum]UZP04660.1 Ig domain-containing protein [Clostridium botulinum]UZP08072.1 Ig domain-containing protein [Clostridium botulinum]UZP11399.1 Ig domain-containing protein [Clostridium botulinum]
MNKQFKKILIMFVMILTIIGIGAFQNGTIANAATVGDQLLQPENGWQRFDTCDKNFEYIGSWKYLKEDANHYNNDHETTKIVGDKIKFNFIGTKLRIIATQDSAAANNVGGSADVYIDGSKVGSYTNNNTVLQQSKLYFENTSLNNCEHDVEVIVTNVGSYHRGFTWDCIDIDGYLVNSNESISLDNTAMNLTVNDSKQLTATTTPSALEIGWSSSDETIATVDKNGKITGIKVGTCIVTAQIKGTDIKTDCIVTVIKEDIIEPEEPSIENGSLYIEMIDGNVKRADKSQIEKFKKWFISRDLDETESPIFKITNAKGNTEYLVHDKVVGFEMRE